MQTAASVVQNQQEIVIYTPHGMDMRDFIIKEFRERTGIKTTIISAGTGALLQQIATDPHTPQGDVFWGGGADSLEAYKYLFQPYTSEQEPYFLQGYDTGEQLWHSLSLMPMVIVYNTMLVPKDKIPTTWSALLDPYFANQLRMGDPVFSGSSFSMLCTLLAVFGQYSSGWKNIETLSNLLGYNGVTSRSEDVYTSVAAGEAFAGLTFEDAVIALKAQNANVDIIYPTEGTTIVPEGVALLHNARHPEEAKQFIEFVLSKDVQAMVSEQWHRRSIRIDVDPPKGSVPLQSIHKLPYNYALIADKKTFIITHWQTIRSIR